MPTRRLLYFLLALLLLVPAAAAAAPKAAPSSGPSKPSGHEATVVDYAGARRLLDRADAAVQHPEKATDAQLAQAARDLLRAGELEPDLDLQPWFHAHLGTVFYARTKAKRGAERRYFLERANAQFKLAALTHGISIGDTPVSRVADYEAAGDATASFILYYVGLTEYETGIPSEAVFALDLLLAAADQRDLKRPEYVAKARTLVAEVRRSAAKHGQWVPSPPATPAPGP